jgi:hypothetical protein
VHSKTETFLSVRVTPEFKQWAKRIAKQERSTMPKLLDTALIELAKARGFEGPPPKP